MQFYYLKLPSLIDAKHMSPYKGIIHSQYQFFYTTSVNITLERAREASSSTQTRICIHSFLRVRMLASSWRPLSKIPCSRYLASRKAFSRFRKFFIFYCFIHAPRLPDVRYKLNLKKHGHALVSAHVGCD